MSLTADSTWASSYDRPVIQLSPGDIPGVQPFVDNSNPQNRCTLFVGKLRSPGGNDRLVFLDMKITLNGGRRTRQNAAKGNESDPEYGRAKRTNRTRSTKSASAGIWSIASTTPLCRAAIRISFVPARR